MIQSVTFMYAMCIHLKTFLFQICKHKRKPHLKTHLNNKVPLELIIYSSNTNRIRIRSSTCTWRRLKGKSQKIILREENRNLNQLNAYLCLMNIQNPTTWTLALKSLRQIVGSELINQTSEHGIPIQVLVLGRKCQVSALR